MRFISKIIAAVALAFTIPCAVSAQTKINPNTQINWVQATGSGAPTASCDSLNYGQPYVDTTGNVGYVCSTIGWVATYSVGTGFLPANNLTSSSGGNLNAPGTVTANTLSTLNLAGALLPVWGAGPPSATGAGCITAFGATPLMVDGQRYIDTTNSIEYACHQITISPGVFSGIFVQITGLSGTVSNNVFATPQRVQAPFQDNGGEKYNVMAFGAVSDAKVSKVCSMTAGSAVLTCDDAPFTSGNVGNAISVEYAGVTAGSMNGNLETTIASYTDASHVTLAAVAANTTPTGLIDLDGGIALWGGPGYQDLGSGTVSSQASATITGAIGQTCLLSNFNNGGTTATASVTVSGTNNIAGNKYTVTNGGGGTITAFPTSATLSNGTATCSGTVTVSTQIDSGFGYYSGQWATTTSGSGTGATISIYSNLQGGGVNENYQPPHLVVNQGTGYAVGDFVYASIAGSDTAGAFKVFHVDKAAAIWGTDNYSAFNSWWAACNGTKNCFVPAGKFLVTSAGNTHKINFGSNTSVTMDPAGAIYVIGVQPGYCTTAGWSVFGTADGTTTSPVQNIHINGLHLEGELQNPGQYAFGCGPRAFNIGAYNNDIEIAHSTFNHNPGAAIAAFSAGGTGIKIHDNYCDAAGDSCFNINALGLEVKNNTFVNSPGMELGGGPGLVVSGNIDYSGFGVSQIAGGGASAGEPYYGGQIIGNQIINPLRNGINVTSAFSKGMIANNLITGMTGWYGQSFGILQGGCFVLCEGNTYTNNVIETANSNSLGGYAAMSIGSSGLLGNTVLIGNTTRGGWGNGLVTSNLGTTVGIGNSWSGGTLGAEVDFSLTAGTYISSNDTLTHGRYTWHNTDKSTSVKGSFLDASTGNEITFGSASLTQVQWDSYSTNPLTWMTQSGALQGYGLASLQIVAPVAGGITVTGTAGSTTYTYYCTAVSFNGIETPAGATVTTSTGNATLSSTNYNKVSCPVTIGAASYNYYRTVGGATQGRIAVNQPAFINNGSNTISDTGLTATAVSPPTTNLTGGIKMLGTTYTPAGTGAFLTTGPNTSTTDNVMTAKDTTGGIKDSGISVNNLCQTNGTHCPSSAGITLIASGSLALSTSSIAANSCQTVTAGSVNSATATGVATTDVISFTPNVSLSAVTGYSPASASGLYINAYPTAGFVNFDVCNQTSAAITPGAVTLNWRVAR